MGAPRSIASGRAGRVDPSLFASLLAILETGNVSRAADALGITQPAVSQNLRKLREHFGDRLFVRSGNSLQPTPRMLALQPVMARVLEDLDRLSRPAGGFEPDHCNREFTVSMSDSAEFAVLPQVAAEFALHSPGARLRGVRTPYMELSAMLERGDVDLALGSLIGAAPSLRQQRLADHRMVCLVSAEGRWAVTPPFFQDYVDGRHVAVLRVSDNADAVAQRLRLIGIQRNVVIRVSNDFVAAQSLIRTDALCTVGEAVGRQLAGLFPVKAHPLPFDVGPITTRMIWHERFQDDAGHIWLRKLVRRTYREWAETSRSTER